MAFIAVASLALAAVPARSRLLRAQGHRAQQAVPGRPCSAADRLHPRRRVPFRTHGPRRKKRIAIGFDDGPSDYTLSVLRVLRRFDSHATFFEIGQETPGRGRDDEEDPRPGQRDREPLAAP